MNLRIRLTHKIATIGAIGVLGLAIVGGLYLFGSGTQARFQKAAEDTNALAMLTNKLSIQMLLARRAEKDFLLRRDDRYAKNHGEVVKTAAANMDDIAQRLTALNQIDLVQNLAAARADYDGYVKHFAALADAMRKNGLTENDGLQGTLRKSVHDIESTIKELNDAKLEASMLTMRRHEKDYMLRRDAKYGDELKKTVTVFTGILASSDIPAANKTAITQKLTTYQRDFLAYMDGTQAGDREAKALSDAYAKFDPQIVAIEKAIDKIEAEATTATKAAIAATTLEIQIGILVVTLGVILLAFFIARAISKPLTALTGAMAELADGNFEVVLPGLGRKDEIGDIAGAVETFKVKATEKAQREAEEKAEQDRRAAAERDAAMAKMASDFEAAVGGIVQAAVAGDFTQRVDLEGKSGLVLNVGTAINSMCANVAGALDDLMKMLNALAEGELTQRITAEYQGNFATLKDNANTTAERIGATIGQLKAAGREVTNASAEISTSTTDLSQRTEEQAASLEETSASMEEISATVKKNAENAQVANQFTAGTREVANRGGQVVAKAVEAMAKIEDSSRKISDIIGVIDEIARQTNLLALNAAVEAARAGEAGRGFAVVASEVRSLAQRASQAAKDIKDLITNSNGQVKEGVDLVNKAGASLNEIVESIKKVADIVADIANASAEQASGIEQVGKALTQMDEVTQQNSALVEENAATAKTLEHQAKAMDERIAFFRIGDAGEGEQAALPPAAREQRPAVAVPLRGPAAAVKQPPVAPKQPAAAPKRAVAGGNSGGPVGRMQTVLATAVQRDPDWKEF